MGALLTVLAVGIAALIFVAWFESKVDKHFKSLDKTNKIVKIECYNRKRKVS